MQKNENQEKQKDSLGIETKRSPLLWFALLQIPLLLIMLIALYFLMKSREEGSLT